MDRDGTIDTGLGSGTFTGSQQDDQASLADQKIVGVAHTYSDASESECLSDGNYTLLAHLRIYSSYHKSSHCDVHIRIKGLCSM